MSNGGGAAPNPAGGAGPRRPDSEITGGWRAAAAFTVVLLTFAIIFWLMYQVVVEGNVGAYCKVRAFFLPLCLLSFTILGVFVGGWAEAAWRPAGSTFTGLAARAGGGAAFFLISAAVVGFLAGQEDCQSALSYSFSFEKPADVTVEPDRLNSQWYQHSPQNEDVTHGKLFYVPGRDLMDRDPFDDLTFELNTGRGGTVLCPISVRIHNHRSSFKRDCPQAAPADSLSFRLSQDLVAYASKLASQTGSQAPIEAADVGLTQGGEKECFARISASDNSVAGPFNQTFTNDGLNVSSGRQVTVHLYKGDICIKNGSGIRIFPAASASSPSSSFDFLGLIVPKAHAAAPEPCPDNIASESVSFAQLLQSLASNEPEEATATLVSKYRVYECKIYDALLQSSVGPNVAARLLRIIALAPVGWTNNRLIVNDAFPALEPSDKAKRVFDLAVEEYIVSDNDTLRSHGRKLLTTYPTKYVRDRYAEIDIDKLSPLQRLYFPYAGIFLYFRPVISGEHFDKKEMSTLDIMPKVIAEYEKGIALRPYLDKREEVDSYILDFGLGSTVRNFEKSEKDDLVPSKLKPSQNIFRSFLDNIRLSNETYPFNNQIGWATCFAYTPPTQSLKSISGEPLTLDDAEWFKGESVKVTESNFVLSETVPTVLKACPGPGYRDTTWTVESGDNVYRLLRKTDDVGNSWLFVRALKGYGWLKEQPKGSEGQLLN